MTLALEALVHNEQGGTRALWGAGEGHGGPLPRPLFHGDSAPSAGERTKSPKTMAQPRPLPQSLAVSGTESFLMNNSLRFLLICVPIVHSGAGSEGESMF